MTETDIAQPVRAVIDGYFVQSRDMLLHLAAHLEVPLRERNHLLLAAGYAPVFAETQLDAPQMLAVRQILTGHQPYPAIVIDGHGTWWTPVPARRYSSATYLPSCSCPRSTSFGRVCTLTEWRGASSI